MGSNNLERISLLISQPHISNTPELCCSNQMLSTNILVRGIPGQMIKKMVLFMSNVVTNTDEMSDFMSVVMSGLMFDLMSDVKFNGISDVISDVMSNIMSNFMSDAMSDAMSDDISVVLSDAIIQHRETCLLYTSPSPRD